MREAGVNLVSVGHLLVGAARAADRACSTSAGWTECSTCCTAPASRVDLGTPTASPPRVVLHRTPGGPAGRPATGVRLGVGLARHASARARRSTAPAAVRHHHGSWPSATASTPRWRCGTCTTSTARRVRSLLLRHASPAAFRRWLRRRYGDAGGAQRRLGHGVLGPALRRRGRDRRRRGARRPPSTRRSSWTSRRFCDDELARLLPRGARRHPRVTPRTSRSPPTSWPPPARDLDYWRWARRGRRRLQRPLPDRRASRTTTSVLAHDADLTRSLAGGRPWMLMEHSTSAVNWQPRNLAKRAGRDAPQQPGPRRPRRRRRDVLPVARVAVRRREVPLGDAAARRHRHPDLARGGRARRRLCGWTRVAGSGSSAGSRILWDWESLWALDLDGDPRWTLHARRAGRGLLPAPVARRYHRRLRRTRGADLHALRRRARAEPVSRDGRVGPQPHRLRACGRPAPGHLRQWPGRRARRGARGWFPRAAGRAARAAGGGAAAVPRRGDGGSGQRWLGVGLGRRHPGHDCRADVDLHRRPCRRPACRDPERRGRRGSVVRRDPARRPRASARCCSRSSTTRGVPYNGPVDDLEVIDRRGADTHLRFFLNHTDTIRSVVAEGHELLTDTRIDGGRLEVPANAVRVVRLETRLR